MTRNVTHEQDCPCFKCKLASISFGTSAGAQGRAHEKAVRADIDAYRSLRKDGLQPKTVLGASEVARHARTEAQVEGRPEVTL